MMMMVMMIMMKMMMVVMKKKMMMMVMMIMMKMMMVVMKKMMMMMVVMMKLMMMMMMMIMVIIRAGVPQGGVLSPTLFDIYLSDIPIPKISSLNLIIYADDITLTSSHPNINTATHNLLPYLNEIHTWAHNNNLQINPTKTTSTLMTPDPSEYNKPLNIHINNIPISTTSNPTILGLTFDPKLKYSTHTGNTITKAIKTLNLSKLLTSTHWGKSKEAPITTYKTLLFSIIEYANTI